MCKIKIINKNKKITKQKKEKKQVPVGKPHHNNHYRINGLIELRNFSLSVQLNISLVCCTRREILNSPSNHILFCLFYEHFTKKKLT